MKQRPPSVSHQARGSLPYSQVTDFETDAKIQATIHKEFSGKTLLCIAHRLRTIISWDRILVMNAGEVEVSSGLSGQAKCQVNRRAGV